MSTQQVRADAKFLRRVLLGLVLLTIATGIIAALTTVQAVSTNPQACLFSG